MSPTGCARAKCARDEMRERVARALKLVQLDGYGERWPHQLSGGQLQRVAIARAIVIEPHVLLLDEPLSNLDAKLRVEMRGEIRRLQKLLGITVLYVTHDQEEALAISDRIAVMRAGRVEQIATPRAIYEQPVTPFVASFVGTTNLIEGVVRGHEGDVMRGRVRRRRGARARRQGQGGRQGRAVAAARGAAPARPPARPLPAGWATLAGTLGEIEYLGPVTRFTVTLADGTPLHLMALAPPAAPGHDASPTIRSASSSWRRHEAVWPATPFRSRSARSRSCSSACSSCCR